MVAVSFPTKNIDHSFAEIMTMLVTGFVSGNEQMPIEIVKENGDTTVCPQMTNYPRNVHDAAGASFSDKTIVVCGGYEGHGNGYRSECYKLKKSSWESFGHLQTARASHSATSIGDSIWFTGGQGYGNCASETTHICDLITTEILRNDGTISAGPNLPRSRRSHCQTSFGNTILLIGKL